MRWHNVLEPKERIFVDILIARTSSVHLGRIGEAFNVVVVLFHIYQPLAYLESGIALTLIFKTTPWVFHTFFTFSF